MKIFSLLNICWRNVGTELAHFLSVKLPNGMQPPAAPKPAYFFPQKFHKHTKFNFPKLFLIFTRSLWAKFLLSDNSYKIIR